MGWLAHQQNEDGSFGEGPVWIEGYCFNQTGVTASVLLAFLGAGYYHSSRTEIGGQNIGATVRHALTWLMEHQNPDGSIGQPWDHDFMLNTMLGTLAVNEAYGLSESSLLKNSAQESLAFVLRTQRREEFFPEGIKGTWSRYGKNSYDVDLMTTSYALMAIKSGELGELLSDTSSYEIARPYLLYAMKTWPGYSASAMTYRMTSKRRETEDPDLNACRDAILTRSHDEFQRFPLSYYCDAMAMSLIDGPLGSTWRKWGNQLFPKIRGMQTEDGFWEMDHDPTSRLVLTSYALNTAFYWYTRTPVFTSEKK